MRPCRAGRRTIRAIARETQSTGTRFRASRPSNGSRSGEVTPGPLAGTGRDPAGQAVGGREESVWPVVGARVPGPAVADDDGRAVDGGSHPGGEPDRPLGGVLALLVVVAELVATVEAVLPVRPRAVATDERRRDVVEGGDPEAGRQGEEPAGPVGVRPPRLPVGIRAERHVGGRVDDRPAVPPQPGAVGDREPEARLAQVAGQHDRRGQLGAEGVLPERGQGADPVGGRTGGRVTGQDGEGQVEALEVAEQVPAQEPGPAGEEVVPPGRHRVRLPWPAARRPGWV